MDKSVESVILETFNSSNAGRIHFGQVVGNLLEAGVESYDVDYRAGRATYYMPNGKTLTLDMNAPEVTLPATFRRPLSRPQFRKPSGAR